jgi:hypothetical protein
LKSVKRPSKNRLKILYFLPKTPNPKHHSGDTKYPELSPKYALRCSCLTL